MKLCSACKRDLPKESHSKKQWQSKQHQRRCKKCIADNKESQLDYPKTETSVPTTAGSNNSKSPGEGVSCWICLEEGADEKGQPLRRDCSCRGDSGYMHVSCVARYALNKRAVIYFIVQIFVLHLMTNFVIHGVYVPIVIKNTKMNSH